MRLLIVIVCVLALNVIAGAATNVLLPLKISSDGRRLVDQNDNPFMIRGDSSWDAAVQLSAPERNYYLDVSATQGISAVAWRLIDDEYQETGQYARSAPSNYYNQLPFTNKFDFSTVNELYWTNTDAALNYAASKGIVVFGFPIYWGSDSAGDDGWRDEMLTNGAPGCSNFGYWIGSRYQSYTNLVWGIAGDGNIGANLVLKTNTRWFVHGLTNANPVSTIYAPYMGARNSGRDQWGTEPWMNLNLMHWAEIPQDELHTEFQSEYNKTPAMPVIGFEMTFEDEGGALAHDIRKEAYYSWLCGGSGEFFGNTLIWDFKTGWTNALLSTGRTNMVFVRHLFTVRPWYDLEPDFTHQVVTAGYGSGNAYVAAAVLTNQSSLVAYYPNNASATITVNLSELTGPELRSQWYNPRTGHTVIIGTNSNSGSADFEQADTNDWVLVIDDMDAGLPRLSYFEETIGKTSMTGKWSASGKVKLR